MSDSDFLAVWVLASAAAYLVWEAFRVPPDIAAGRPGGREKNLSLDGFPSEEETRRALEWNKKYQKWLEIQLSVRPWDVRISDALNDTQAAWRVWDALLNYYLFRDEWFGVAEDFRDILGKHRFALKAMPDPIPRQYLTEVD
mgnify:CR=1 FL=1